jgi:hypothetical protein
MILTKRKSSNASTAAQRAWAILTPKQKAILLKRYRQDPDKDGVPTGFDCQPYNKKKQESFAPDDLKWITANKIETDRKIGSGMIGDVATVKGNKNLIVKTVTKLRKPNKNTPRDVIQCASRAADFRKTAFDAEIRFYEKNHMYKEPLIIPSKHIALAGTNEIGIVRPVVKPVVDPSTGRLKNKNLVTEKMLLDAQRKLTILSYKGYIFSDGLQLGIDKTGKLLQFDVGQMKKINNSRGKISNIPFKHNNVVWLQFIQKFKKYLKVGPIERTQTLDKKYM